jgi:hypothetical protein
MPLVIVPTLVKDDPTIFVGSVVPVRVLAGAEFRNASEPNADPFDLVHVIFGCANVQSPLSANPPNDPALLNWSCPFDPPGDPAPETGHVAKPPDVFGAIPSAVNDDEL